MVHMFNFLKVSRGARSGLKRKPATQFCALSERTCNKGFFFDKMHWRLYIDGPEGLVQTEFASFGLVGVARAFMEGSGAFRQTRKMEMAKSGTTSK